ncbi:hypothetical protein [Mycolicibacterium sp.]|nr:hypothetical protein [Mycolicibacterium sp.]MBJ7336452.1 hypothetical protein [Mycolicibacterium sp.]
MSGFDTSQPIADDEALKDVDTEKAPTSDDAEEVEAEKLGDATPGPR